MSRPLIVRASCVAALLLSGISSAEANRAVHFASDPTWSTFSQDPGMAPNAQGHSFVGPAQNVCPNSFSPANCPPDATIYGYPFSSWFANLAAIPGATWIWAPGITGGTSGADLAKYFFSKAIILMGEPTGGTIYVAADDFLELRVNGITVGTWGSVTNINQAGVAQNNLHSFDVGGMLKPGRNVITIVGQNGPAAFTSGVCSACTYAQNPAGVVFGGTLTFQPRDGDLPTDDLADDVPLLGSAGTPTRTPPETMRATVKTPSSTAKPKPTWGALKLLYR